MITKELIEYIKKCREQNISDEQIKSTLKEQGWTDGDINAGFSQVSQFAKPTKPAESIKTQKPKKKFLIPIIIIIGVLIIGGGIFTYFQFFRERVKIGGEEQKNETAVWKTYKNEQYGFEFKYPSDWQVIIDKDADKTDTIKDGHLFEVSKYETVGAAEISGVFEVNVFNFDDNQANFEKNITSIKRLYPNNWEVSQDGLSGYKGENYVLDNAAETMTSLEVFLGNKGVYQVLTHYLDFRDGNYKKQTELIRSTLKFFQ